MSIEVFVDLIKNAPYLAVPVGLILLTYKIIGRLVDSPLTIATIVSVLGPKRMRDDAYRTIKALRGDSDDEQPAIKPPPDPPPDVGRRKPRR